MLLTNSIVAWLMDLACLLVGHADVDEPPRSDAGQDVVIQLPTDWAILDGRDSVDDHRISHYEWTLIKGDTAIGMKVSVEPQRSERRENEQRQDAGVSSACSSHMTSTFGFVVTSSC